MARKVTFDIPEDGNKPETGSAALTRSQSRAPALSGMARSLQDAAQASVQEIDTALIDDSEFRDRLNSDDQIEIEELAESIKAQGQLIPILVSPVDGRYKIIYGRRRLAALRLLGKPAKALIRSLDEDQAILAQGQENTFRKDLSWIEKAAFARALMDSGKETGLICDALNVDQKARREGAKLTGLARMLQVTACIPLEIIEAVGAAPGVGRDRWYAAAKAYENSKFPAGNSDMVAALVHAKTAGHTSDERFALFESTLRKQKTGSTSVTVTEHGSVRVSKRTVSITVKNGDDGLHAWISENPNAALAALLEARDTAAKSLEKVAIDRPHGKDDNVSDTPRHDLPEVETTEATDNRN